jgi:hypothetical protein
MQKVQKTLLYLAFLLPPSVALFIYGYLGSFTRMIADDYCSAYYAKDMGLVDSIMFWYKTWSGRYSAFGIDWVALNLFDAYHINWIPPLTLLMWLIVMVATVHLFLRSKKPQRDNVWHALVLGTIILFLVMTLSPNIPESLYWWNGMRSYMLPLVVLTFGAFVFMLFEQRAKTKQSLVVGILFFFALAFANGGLSETYVVLQLVLFVFLIFIRFLSVRTIKADFVDAWLFSGVLGTLTSLAIVLHSYGNVIRRSLLPPAPDLITLTGLSLKFYVMFLGNIFFQIEDVLALLGSMLVAIWIGHQYGNQENISSSKIAIFFLGGFLLSFVTFPPGVYGYSNNPPSRALSLTVFALVVFFMYASFLTGNWLAGRKKLNNKQTQPIALSACMLILIASTLTGTSLYRSRNTYMNFAKEWDRVDAQILQAKAAGEESVTIQALENWAGLLRPNNNPNFWVTNCYSLYYGIQVSGPPYGW